MVIKYEKVKSAGTSDASESWCIRNASVVSGNGCGRECSEYG